MKHKTSKLCRQNDPSPQPSLEQLLQDKKFSDENVEFWLACEDYRSSSSADALRRKAWGIYEKFIQPTACRERFIMDRDDRRRNKNMLSLEDTQQWSQSLERLLESKYGLATFRNFLKSEYSDENIEFWLTCEDYKKIKSSFRMSSRAKKIYEQFIKVESPKEINIDYHTREQIKRNVKTPTLHCFDDAQKIVYGLMERDSYPRFLRSDIYRTLLENLAADAA
ncbi:unnamed protein product, partial [Tetraodon nigroviridis]